MRNLSKIFLLIGGIFGILSILGLLVCAGLMLYTSKNMPDETMLEVFEPILNLYVPHFTDAQKLEFLRVFMNSMFVTCLVEAALTVAAVALSFASRGKTNTGLFVATIVFGVLAGFIIFVILGAIFGIVANGQESRRQRADNAY